jgi:hypothetical protein
LKRRKKGRETKRGREEERKRVRKKMRKMSEWMREQNLDTCACSHYINTFLRYNSRSKLCYDFTIYHEDGCLNVVAFPSWWIY